MAALPAASGSTVATHILSLAALKVCIRVRVSPLGLVSSCGERGGEGGVGGTVA